MFVAPSGSRHSYVKGLQNARTYPSLEAAQADACGNETPVRVEDVMES